MLLTLYFMAATWIQSWRLKTIYDKLSKYIAQQNASIVFYNIQNEEKSNNITTTTSTTITSTTTNSGCIVENGTTSNTNTNNTNLINRGIYLPSISSELCTDYQKARILDLIWLNNCQRGVVLVPKQIIHLGAWLTFPQQSPNLVPIDLSYNKELLVKLSAAENDEQQTDFHILIETDLMPTITNNNNNDESVNNNNNYNCLAIEQFGKPIAWKVDSRLAIILKSNLTLFTELVMRSFMQENLIINDRLPLFRIQSVTIDGEPQQFESIRNHCRKDQINRIIRYLPIDRWCKHIDGLRSMNILASQASEFEYNKNRTEGKTGRIKSDLSPSHKQKSPILSPKTSAVKTIKKLPIDSADIISGGGGVGGVNNISLTNFTNTPNQIKKPSPKSSPRTTSPLHLIVETSQEDDVETEKLNQLPPFVPVISSQSDEENKLNELKQIKTPPKPQNQIINNDLAKDIQMISSIITNDTNQDKLTKEIMQTTPQLKKEVSAIDGGVKESTNNFIKSEQLSSPKLSSSSTAVVAPAVATTIIPAAITPTVVAETLPATSSASSVTPITSRFNDTPIRPQLIRSKGSLLACKPPNVLVYSESLTTRDAVISTLSAILEPDMYTIYPLQSAQIKSKIWLDNTTFLVVCGTVPSDIGEVLTEYFLRGGKLLSLCSDILHIVLPTFRTHAEVREHELVQFSYGRWHRVRMMHHIFCYQPSPVRKNFSTDSDEPQILQKKPIQQMMLYPRSVEVMDQQNQIHNLQVEVLGTEETWNTPSLLLATNPSSGGKAVFSQVHLEADPNTYENDPSKFLILKQNDRVRIEILCDLLSAHLGLVVMTFGNGNETGNLLTNTVNNISQKQRYCNAYFLGDHKLKFDLLERLKIEMEEPNTIKTERLTMKFCSHREEPPKATATLQPILINSCPENFSTIDYFDNLKSEIIGRLAIYVPVISSTTDIMGQLKLGHGLAVIARQQTGGVGRNNNQWLSPDGCVMFSLQLHIPLNSPIGQRLSLIQHIMAVAISNAVLTIKTGYEVLNIGLKWPNDIYANCRTKIGGLITTSQIQSTEAICNLGCGINLSNSKPTVCINDLIKDHNGKCTNVANRLAEIKYEHLLAQIFTEFERIYNKIQNDNDFSIFYDLYYKLWLHSAAEVTILDAMGNQKIGKITGIDEYGYLLVKHGSSDVSQTVHPDGNSFDMLRGLIIPK